MSKYQNTERGIKIECSESELILVIVSNNHILVPNKCRGDSYHPKITGNTNTTLC